MGNLLLENSILNNLIHLKKLHGTPTQSGSDFEIKVGGFSSVV